MMLAAQQLWHPPDCQSCVLQVPTICQGRQQVDSQCAKVIAEHAAQPVLHQGQAVARLERNLAVCLVPGTSVPAQTLSVCVARGLAHMALSVSI